MGDADTTYDFAELPRLLEPVRSGRADICMGDRLGGTIEDGAMPPLHEHVGNPLLTRFLNVFYDAGVSDAHSGFRVFRREILADLELSSTGMEFASEMIMAAGEADLTIEEVPITYHEREGEATLDSFQDGWRHVRFMLVHAPDYLFSLPGLVLGALGVALLGLSVAGVPVAGLRFGTNSAIAGSLLTLTGFQVGSFAVLGSIAADPIRTPDGSVTGWLLESFRLEHGATAGLVLLGAGAGFTANALLSWLADGAATLPVVPVNMAAFTAIVLGVQVVFTSFFFSLLAGE
jgi:hypothetical protein